MATSWFPATLSDRFSVNRRFKGFEVCTIFMWYTDALTDALT